MDAKAYLIVDIRNPPDGVQVSTYVGGSADEVLDQYRQQTGRPGRIDKTHQLNGDEHLEIDQGQSGGGGVAYLTPYWFTVRQTR